jgi:hypothetical protein
MSMPEDQKPIYDERVNYILRSLAAGVTREELAKEFKHNDYRTLDMYMRRRNFKWDREKKTYVPKETRISHMNDENVHSGKVSRIINAFNEGKDPKTVAIEFGFKSHKELAAYMAKKGYEWNVNEGNYVRKSGVIIDEDSADKETTKTGDNNKEQLNGNEKQEIIHLIKTLYEKLNIKVEDPIVDKVPRYLVKGIAKTKSVQMSHLLHQLLEDYSYEKNITQRQIIETAIIDFFRKYGYKHEVDALLSQ